MIRQRRLLSLFVVGLMVSSLFASPVSSKNRPVSRADVAPSSEKLKLAIPGTSGPIPYKKYGKFLNVGTKKYRYSIKDKKGLAEAAGEGIFPNRDAYKDPAYRALNKKRELQGSHWTYVDTPNAARNFYKWATTREDPGVTQFYSAIMMERAGLIEEAIKAFYAIVVHFPKTVSYTYYQTPWYVGPTSLDRIEQLLRRHPKIKMKLVDAKFDVQGIFDVDTSNDVIATTPGELVKAKRRKKTKPAKLHKMKVVKKVGGDKIELRQYENGHWQFLVDKKPFPVRAITYSVSPVGLSPDRGTLNVSRDWQLLDTNNNGIHDGFFESFVDKNKNNKRDANEPVVGDAKLLADMGINALRAYHHVYDKNVFRKLYEERGIYLLVGDLLGGYATGSGAAWADGTDYRDPKQRQTMLNSVRSMVMDHKDEPYVLMWVLGNENLYGVANNSDKYPEEFFDLVNEAAQLIHELDPTRPVVHSNGDLLHADIFAARCPDVDVFGANVYRGEQGPGRSFFRNVQKMTGKPVLITEYGASSIAEGYTKEQSEEFQAMYVANNWEDMEAHMAGYGVGNALGGVLFEWTDEWWKANSDLPDYVKKQRPEWYAERSATYKSLQPDKQETVPQFGLPFLDGWSYEEWFGVASVGNGENSAFVRQLRPLYWTMKKMWNKK